MQTIEDLSFDGYNHYLSFFCVQNYEWWQEEFHLLTCKGTSDKITRIVSTIRG